MSDDAKLTHIDAAGVARMVDVSAKTATARVATARGRVVCDVATLALLRARGNAKGDPVQVARIAGIQAAKQTASLIPLCHPLPLTHLDVDIRVGDAAVDIEATARCVGPTGVEMEALTAVAVAALTIIDMAKASDRWMTIESVGLVAKSGGRSGAVERPAERPL